MEKEAFSVGNLGTLVRINQAPIKEYLGCAICVLTVNMKLKAAKTGNLSLNPEKP